MLPKEEITSKDIKRLMLDVYRRYRAREINEPQATKEAALLTTCLKTMEVADLEEKLNSISSALKGI